MIKVGIVGMGLRGNLFAQTIMQNEHAELVAVSDSYEHTLEKSMETYGVKGYLNPTDMLEREQLDAVVIATPDYLHKEPVIAAARKGLHILVEKPFSTSVEEAEEMALEIKKSGVKCLVAFENRWNMPIIAVKEAIHNGEIGNIVTLNSRLNDTIYVPTKMLKWSQGSTPAWFLFPHMIDLALWFSKKEPISVYAVGTKKKLVSMGIDTYDSIQAIVHFADQTHATFTTSWILPESMPMIYDFKYEIIGEDGALYVDLADQMVRKAVADYKHVHSLGTPVQGRLTSAPSYMMNAFIDDIRLDREPLATAEDGLINTKIIDAVHQSIQTGTIISIA